MKKRPGRCYNRTAHVQFRHADFPEADSRRVALARVPQFFPHHAPQDGFERLLRTLDIRAQCLIDQVLIASASGIVDLLAEPVQHFVIQRIVIRDLPRGTLITAPRLASEKLYCFFMYLPRTAVVPGARLALPKSSAPAHHATYTPRPAAAQTHPAL